jgi:hypothetical protein
LCHSVGTLGRDNCRVKICPRCQERKALDEFYRKKDRLAGSYCKPCQHAYVREHYAKTSAVYNARRYALHLTYTERNRRLVLDHLANHPCIDCGERDIVVLDFDHVRGVKLDAVSRMIFGGTSERRLRAEIDKCVVRCANCHRRKTALECGSYRTRPWLYQKAGSEISAAGQAIRLWDGGGSNSRQTA